MDSEQIARELEGVLLRYKLGMIELEEAKQQQSLLMDALKAREQVVLERKLDRLEAIIEERRRQPLW